MQHGPYCCCEAASPAQPGQASQPAAHDARGARCRLVLVSSDPTSNTPRPFVNHERNRFPPDVSDRCRACLLAVSSPRMNAYPASPLTLPQSRSTWEPTWIVGATLSLFFGSCPLFSKYATSCFSLYQQSRLPTIPERTSGGNSHALPSFFLGGGRALLSH